MNSFFGGVYSFTEVEEELNGRDGEVPKFISSLYVDTATSNFQLPSGCKSVNFLVCAAYCDSLALHEPASIKNQADALPRLKTSPFRTRSNDRFIE